MFKKNIGIIERWVRVGIGMVIAGLGIYYQSWWGLLAIGPFTTAAIGYCPLYALLGVNTCMVDPKSHAEGKC